MGEDFEVNFAADGVFGVAIDMDLDLLDVALIEPIIPIP
jgi:hypothetical protein